MTVVVGIEGPGGVWFGSDGLVATSESQDAIRDPKWNRLGPVTIGWAGDLRGAQVARSLPAPRNRQHREHPIDWLMSSLVDPLRLHLQEKGAATGGHWLVAAEGKLYVLQDDWSILRPARGYAAIGAGAAYALGAMEAADGLTSIQERLNVALAATVVHCPLVGPPLHVAQVSRSRKR